MLSRYNERFLSEPKEPPFFSLTAILVLLILIFLGYHYYLTNSFPNFKSLKLFVENNECHLEAVETLNREMVAVKKSDLRHISKKCKRQLDERLGLAMQAEVLEITVSTSVNNKK